VPVGCCVGARQPQRSSLTTRLPYAWIAACQRETRCGCLLLLLLLLHHVMLVVLCDGSSMCGLRCFYPDCTTAAVYSQRHRFCGSCLGNVCACSAVPIFTEHCCICFVTLSQVGTNYDPMIAKIVTHAADRESALQLLRQALAETQVCFVVGSRSGSASNITSPACMCCWHCCCCVCIAAGE
jgi:hypothetical protein